MTAQAITLRAHRASVWRAASAPTVLALVFALAQLSDLVGIPVSFCVSKVLLGVPCPGCGITTSVTELFRGNGVSALQANAAGPFVLLFVAVQLLLVPAAAARSLPDDVIARYSQLNDRGLLAVLLFSWFIRLFKGV